MLSALLRTGGRTVGHKLSGEFSSTTILLLMLQRVIAAGLGARGRMLGVVIAAALAGGAPGLEHYSGVAEGQGVQTGGEATGAGHQRGVDLYKEQKYREAVAALEQAAAGEDVGSAAYQESALLIGQSYFMLLEAPKAIPWLEKAPEGNERNWMLGYAYLQTGRAEEAEGAFARLFGLEAGSAAGHMLAAQMMLKREYETQALVELKKAAALDAKMPELHFLMGEIAIYRGELEEGVAEMRAELGINPNFSMAWYRLGDAYAREEKWEAAIPNLQRAVWLNPDYSGPYIVLGKCYFHQQNWANAEGILRRALAIDPRNYSATYLLGQTLMGEGKKEEGRAVLDKLKGLREER